MFRDVGRISIRGPMCVVEAVQSTRQDTSTHDAASPDHQMQQKESELFEPPW